MSFGGATTAGLALLAIAVATAGCAPEPPPHDPGVLVVSQEQHASWVRNFNPLTTATAARWPTLAGVYEPLYVFNSVQGEQVPWLATGHAWEDSNLALRFTLREGVRWSDGEAFDSDDVVFTFGLMREHAPLDRRGVWQFLEDVEADGPYAFRVRFSRVFIPGLDEVANTLIVPEHHWSQVEDPVAFPNPDPVATGPFTEVLTFRNQIYELGRNPHYWQPGRPAVEKLRFPAYPSNDRANLALVFDEVDWAANFIPAIERVYVERDPEHHRYWFPLTGSTIFLYANTTRAPFDDVAVRKALSQGVDRELLVDVATFGYTRPADATALSDAYRDWRDGDLPQRGWVEHDPAAAAAALDAAGYPAGPEGIRRDAAGEPLAYEILTVSGWSDWVRAAQVIARGLQGIGVDASVRTYDFGAWFERVQKGDFDLSLGWSFEGPTPYIFYRCLMGSATVRPVGVTWGANWHRYGSPAADRVLEAFEAEPDPAAQRELVRQLQEIFVREAPAIPLYPNPSWAEYNTSRFTGFPSAQDPYADPSPNKFDRGECLLVLTRLEPRAE